MKHETTLSHEFVEFIPNKLMDGKVYVSIKFATVAHKCCCGCGCEVVTPLGPSEWRLIFDGKSISLEPSIGNWGLKCHSHYFIRRDKVVWLPSKMEQPSTSNEIKLSPTKKQNLRSRVWQNLKRWWS